ncbi:hypothetical protein A3I30_01300 [Candidatus Azambacteria bacterium RIFCSPLOWO2_02_FULL_44_14]|uniref:Uncharacterized protein n=1 Tax=Candidatus Azambacteria bacterium RIFCSPLOWO2_02_FULL_44_14 TaxID=1797306 RepID=A0A1F5CC36_9BACT|nr:MAG: hypothetical protein A3I30_01300 [Candidatus Azambacteria bacterium RIFCSPLOWO2_02_FULL_44_14]
MFEAKLLKRVFIVLFVAIWLFFFLVLWRAELIDMITVTGATLYAAVIAEIIFAIVLEPIIKKIRKKLKKPS